MNHRNVWALGTLSIALFLGFASLALASRWLGTQPSSSVQVVVASRDVDLGTTLDGTALTTMSWVGSVLPEGAFTDVASLLGRVVKTSLTRGEPILESKLASQGSKAGLAAVITQGKRAITVKVNEVAGVAGFALPGSHVDVMVHTNVESATSGAGLPKSKIVLERILVLAVAQEAGRDDTRPKVVNAVTLEVTPQEAELLDVARSVGTLSLVLRSQVDKALADTSGRAKADLFAHHQSSQPQSVSGRVDAPRTHGPRTPMARVGATGSEPSSKPAPSGASTGEARGVSVIKGVALTVETP